jgi:fatty acid desaturase
MVYFRDLAKGRLSTKISGPQNGNRNMATDAIRIERPSTNSRLFAHTRWDAVPAAAGLFHLAYLFGLYFLFPHAPLWVMLILGFVYALMVNANINGVGHNFIHNPFFRSQLLNRLFGITQSIACCFSQTMYDAVHMQHHKGNSDRQDEKGDTIDWLSIYRHGHDGEAENPWSYVFLSFFRDDVGTIRKDLRKRKNGDEFWGNAELAAFATTLLVMAIIVPTNPIHFINWRFMLYFLPVWYLGHCFSYLNGYFRHYGANPDKPIAWGVSSYGRIYNWLFFYNGYHAEHHFRPKVHWTKMEKFRRSIENLQKQEGVRTIKRAHMLGFLDPDLPKRAQRDRMPKGENASSLAG